MHLTAPSHWSRSIATSGRDVSERVVTIVVARRPGPRTACRAGPFAGLDVSVKETSVCIVDDAGRIVREVKVASEPEALLAVLKNPNPTYRFKRIGLEGGQCRKLFGGLAEAGLPVICVETHHIRAALKAQINKTDRNDARSIAQMMRVALYRPVHVETLRRTYLKIPGCARSATNAE
jgi:hypothetical protein